MTLCTDLTARDERDGRLDAQTGVSVGIGSVHALVAVVEEPNDQVITDQNGDSVRAEREEHEQDDPKHGRTIHARHRVAISHPSAGREDKGTLLVVACTTCQEIALGEAATRLVCVDVVVVLRHVELGSMLDRGTGTA